MATTQVTTTPLMPWHRLTTSLYKRCTALLPPARRRNWPCSSYDRRSCSVVVGLTACRVPRAHPIAHRTFSSPHIARTRGGQWQVHSLAYVRTYATQVERASRPSKLHLVASNHSACHIRLGSAYRRSPYCILRVLCLCCCILTGPSSSIGATEGRTRRLGQPGIVAAGLGTQSHRAAHSPFRARSGAPQDMRTRLLGRPRPWQRPPCVWQCLTNM
ncbi:hypothetical protein OH77DRAFT_1286267 [Trametes cingulata]|nr:hypothetical protein OH77DRAFT_1286267 [Trametes cingulata]